MQKPDVKAIEIMAKFNNNKDYAMFLIEECINSTQYNAHTPYKVPPIETKEFWIEVRSKI
jgi:hypothetical protein